MDTIDRITSDDFRKRENQRPPWTVFLHDRFRDQDMVEIVHVWYLSEKLVLTNIREPNTWQENAVIIGVRKIMRRIKSTPYPHFELRSELYMLEPHTRDPVPLFLG